VLLADKRVHNGNSAVVVH